MTIEDWQASSSCHLVRCRGRKRGSSVSDALPLGGRNLDARGAAPAVRGLLRPGGDPFPKAGDGREYSVILISSAAPAGPPPTVRFIAPEEVAHVEIPLEGFTTAAQVF